MVDPDLAVTERSAPVELTDEILRSWPLPLDGDGDKFARGSVLVIGGSARTPGAVELAGVAALRSGAGRLQLATVASVAPALSIAVPEALVESLPESDDGAIEPDGDLGRLEDRVQNADAVLFGPGLEDLGRARRLLRWVLDRLDAESVLVIDALGLRCLGGDDPVTLRTTGSRVVLTPNRGECAELLPALADGEPDSRRAMRVAASLGAVVTVHGHTAAPDGRRWWDGSGTVGLATSGSGDVLAGLVTGVAARGGDAAQAACWGSHLHAAAGRRLADRIGPVGFLAREIADEAPLVLATLAP